MEKQRKEKYICCVQGYLRGQFICKLSTPEMRVIRAFELLHPVQFSSVQDGIHALGKAHMRSTLSLRSFPNVAFQTVLSGT